MVVEPRVHFDAVLTPHRALSPRGLVVVMALVIAASGLAALGFSQAGAWPVLGFMGLDVLLIWLALRAGMRRALVERVRLTDDALEVINMPARGPARSWRLDPAWTQIRLEEDRLAQAQLSLWSRGRGLEIGAFLAPDERRSLAEALRSALRARERALIGH